MKKITEVYGLKKGETYWISVGDKNTTPTNDDINSTQRALNHVEDFKFIVAPYTIRPIMIKKKVAVSHRKDGDKSGN